MAECVRRGSVPPCLRTADCRPSLVAYFSLLQDELSYETTWLKSVYDQPPSLDPDQVAWLRSSVQNAAVSVLVIVATPHIPCSQSVLPVLPTGRVVPFD